MSQGLITVAYVAASVLFILSLGGLSHQETARRGNVYGIAGILIAFRPALAFDVVAVLYVASGLLLLLLQRLVLSEDLQNHSKHNLNDADK